DEYREGRRQKKRSDSPHGTWILPKIASTLARPPFVRVSQRGICGPVIGIGRWHGHSFQSGANWIETIIARPAVRANGFRFNSHGAVGICEAITQTLAFAKRLPSPRTQRTRRPICPRQKASRVSASIRQ